MRDCGMWVLRILRGGRLATVVARFPRAVVADALDDKIGCGCPPRCVTSASSHTIHERGEAVFYKLSRVVRDLLFQGNKVDRGI